MKYLTARHTRNSDGESSKFLYINNCGAFINTSKSFQTSRPDGRTDFQLLYISSGKLELSENLDKNIIESGNVILFRPHEPQLYRVHKGSTFYWIHFSGTAAHEMAEFVKSRSVRVGAFPEFEEFCTETVQAFAAKKTSYDTYCAGRLVTLFALLAQKLDSQEVSEREVLKNALLDIHTNFTLQRTNDEYAEMCGLSKSHFIRIFNKCTGMPPQKYRTSIVMREAKHLLKNNSVNETADILGFSDVFYFSRLFKKTLGMPPREYKKMHFENNN